MEVEYVVILKAVKEVIWLTKFLMRLGVVPLVVLPLILFCDNNGAIT